MARFWPVLLFIALFVFVWLQPEKQPLPNESAIENTPQRIISLSPSITETLFAIGAGDRVVAVTTYCRYPDAVTRLPDVGGYLDASLEQIVRLQPDLVILLDRQLALKNQLQQLGIKTLSVNNSSLAGIRRSISDIALAVGEKANADRLLSAFNQRLQDIKNKVAGQTKPDVLLVIAHSTGSHLDKVYIAGQQDFYNDLLRYLGATNVYRNPQIKVPALSIEGLLQLNPQIIVDIFPDAEVFPIDIADIKQQWQQLDKMTAIQHDQLHIIQADYAVIPGLRIIQLAERLAQIFHPQLDWETRTNAD